MPFSSTLRTNGITNTLAYNVFLSSSHPPPSSPRFRLKPPPPPPLRLLESNESCYRKVKCQSQTQALTLAGSRASARTQPSLNTCMWSPGIAALSSTHTHTTILQVLSLTPCRPLPLLLVISICEDRHSSGMQMRPSARMHIYLAAEAGGEADG